MFERNVKGPGFALPLFAGAILFPVEPVKPKDAAHGHQSGAPAVWFVTS
jgi:hypothetical protein